jgi:folate-binding protein YgfZ
MNATATTQSATRLDGLGTIVVKGLDARNFLQGQLSFDLGRLTSQYVELASVNSAQGRVQAVIWLLARSDTVTLLLPAELVDPIIARLRKFVLRAKVTIESGAGQLTIGAITTDAVPHEVRGHIEQDGVSLIRWAGQAPRGLILVPAGSQMPADRLRADAWHLEDIRAGLPQVYPATYETFVGQMLNLDLLQGISFDKGCYTGQEIIARMHFRGQVKRRMLRFAFSGAPPGPGTRVVSDGNHAGDVVDAAATPTGSELLAVINLAQQAARLEIDGQPGRALEPLPLPYEVRQNSES